MSYRELYKQKIIDVEGALKHIKSNDEVVCGLASCEPVEILKQLHTIKDRVLNVSVVHALTLGRYDFIEKPEMKGHFILKSWFYGAAARVSHELETVAFVPMELHQFSRSRLAYRKPNVFLGCASPMDKHGYVSLSLSTVMEKDFIEKADCVILEVNPNFPRTHGDTHIHVSEIDYIVESNRPVPTLPVHQTTEKDRRIGQFIADLVEDGSTIQIGVGSIPSAAAIYLNEKKDLGVHSEVLSDAILDLYESGAVTNRKKSIFKNKFITNVGLGTRRLYDFLDDNPAIEFHRGSIVNNPAVIAQNEKMVSINSVIEIDLTGQCCAESIGNRQFSGTGGHKEYASGVKGSRGGKSILAFYSSAKNDQISRIVPFFKPGTVVTTSRVDVDYVVTEYGVASLRGRSVIERVRELINIAHPNFRDQLEYDARLNMIW